MPNDQYGRPVAVGDTVTIKGEVVKVLDDPNYVNCTVKLASPMPPSGAETNVQCNTAQVENLTPKPPQAPKPPGEFQGGHPPHQPFEQKQPEHAEQRGSKK